MTAPAAPTFDFNNISRSGTPLLSILSGYFLPELGYQQGQRSAIGSAFGDLMSRESEYGAASTAASGVAADLFKPGGQIASMIAKARGGVIGQGFAPSGADRSVNGILTAGTEQVANSFAQNAGQLEANRMSAIANAYGQSNQNIQSLIESLFSGTASQAQLTMEQNKNKRGILGKAWHALF